MKIRQTALICGVLGCLIAQGCNEPSQEIAADKPEPGQSTMAVKKTDNAKPKAKENVIIDLGEGEQLEMVWIPSGKFSMGDTNSGADAKYIHTVELDGFWMSNCEVTNGQFRRFNARHNSGRRSSYNDSDGAYNIYNYNGKLQPVVKVSWDDAIGFCDWLTSQTSKTFTLPTEAQWEYACRAGTTGAYYIGDSETGLGRVASYEKNSRGVTDRVGVRVPNNCGLYDMHGHVEGWCMDWYDENFYSTPEANQKNPTGPASGSHRVVRGGSFNCSARLCRSAIRRGYDPSVKMKGLGFRVCCTSPLNFP